MVSSRARLKLGIAGLVLVAWALVVAPALHAAAHARGHEDSPADATPLGSLSFLHHAVVFIDAAPAPTVVAVWRPIEDGSLAQPTPPSLPLPHRTEQPGAP